MVILQSTKYKVNEIFSSHQGEGFNVGREVVFIRLSGCNLSCNFCDTNHKSFTEMSVEDILKKVNEYNLNSVIITGGEPLIYNLFHLLFMLKAKRYWIAIESNGSYCFDKIIEFTDYITISPKSSKVKNVSDEVRVVNNNLNIDALLDIEKNCIAKHYFLSPLEHNNQFNYLDTIKLLGMVNRVSNKNWHLSLQMHKIIGIG